MNDGDHIVPLFWNETFPVSGVPGVKGRRTWGRVSELKERLERLARLG